MKSACIGALAMVWGLGALPGAALAQRPIPVAGNSVTGSPFVGTWHLNAALSKTPDGEAPSSDLTTVVTRADQAHVHWSTTTMNAKGQKDVRTFDNPGNGEFYSLDPYTMVSHTLTPASLQSTFRDPNGQTDVLTCILAPAGRQMTCNGVVTHTDGSVVRYTDVFDRV